MGVGVQAGRALSHRRNRNIDSAMCFAALVFVLIVATAACSPSNSQYAVAIAPLSADFAAVVATIREGSKDQEAPNSLRDNWGRIGVIDRLERIRSELEAALPTNGSPSRARAQFIAATEAIAKIDQEVSPSCKHPPGVDPISAALNCRGGPRLAPALLADAANRADASWANGIAELRR